MDNIDSHTKRKHGTVSGTRGSESQAAAAAERPAARRDTVDIPVQEHTLEETRTELRALAHQRFGAIPTELIVEQVLTVTEGGDWPLRRGAMEALLRRFSFADRDGLRVAARPAGGDVLGLYETRRSGGGERGKQARSARPYRTVLRGAAPFAGSRDCADYQRGGLGLCKHLLTVLAEVCRKPRVLERARREQQARDNRM